MGAVALYLAMELTALDCDVSDLRRFPSEQYAELMVKSFDERIAYAEKIRDATWIQSHWSEWECYRISLNIQSEPWRRLKRAQTYKGPNHILVLAELREIVGEAGYASGQMP